MVANSCILLFGAVGAGKSALLEALGARRRPFKTVPRWSKAMVGWRKITLPASGHSKMARRWRDPCKPRMHLC